MVWSPQLSDWCSLEDAGFRVTIPPPLPNIRPESSLQLSDPQTDTSLHTQTSQPQDGNPDKEVDYKLCYECGNFSVVENRGCVKCGAGQTDSSVPETSAQTQAPPSQDEISEEEIDYLKCHNCGHYSYLKNIACTRCGATDGYSAGQLGQLSALLVVTFIVSSIAAGLVGYTDALRVGLYFMLKGVGGALVLALISWLVAKKIVSQKKTNRPKYWLHFAVWVPLVTFVYWVV